MHYAGNVESPRFSHLQPIAEASAHAHAEFHQSTAALSPVPDAWTSCTCNIMQYPKLLTALTTTRQMQHVA